MSDSSIISFFAAILFCGFIEAASLPTEESVNVKSNGETKVMATLNGSPVVIKLMAHEIDIGKPSDGRPKINTSSCTYSRRPCSLVDSLDVNVNGQAIFVPRSVFSDLADVNFAYLALENGYYVLTLDGGDASESYTVRVLFDKNMIQKRIMASNEARYVMQETIYFSPPPLD